MNEFRGRLYRTKEKKLINVFLQKFSSMKKLLLALFVLASTTLFAQSKIITAPITDVTVFLSGAQVIHKGEIALKKGETTYVLSGLTAGMDPNSIQVVGNSAYTILSVKHQLNYNARSSNPKVKAVQDSIKLLSFQAQERSSMRNVYQEEKALLQANRTIKGDNSVLLKDDLQEMADFYRARMKEIEYKFLELSQLDREGNEKLSKLQQVLSQLQAESQTNPGEIEFVLKSDTEEKADIEIRYIAQNAGWTPFYDLRSEDLNSDIEFTYRAKVWQGTGNDWKRVNLTISTGNPSQGAQVPLMSPWYINVYQPIAYDKRKREETYNWNQAPSVARDDMSGYAYGINEKSIASNSMMTSASYTVITNNSVSTEFKITVKYDIASDNQPVEVVMQKQKLKATYKYVAIPKLDLAAYLQAEIVDWMQYSLLPGESNIYFKGTFVGNGYIDPALANDTLSLSLGKDASITVKRDQVKDFCKTNVLGGKKTTSKAYEITIVNTKKIPIYMELYDQVPLSQNADIEVTVEDISGATHDLASGEVLWKLDVAAGANVKKQLKFTVKYPKKSLIQNL